MSTSEGLSTSRSGDSRSHQWRLVIDGNVACHLTHNAGKSWKIQEKVRAPGFEPWWVASHWTVLPLDYKSDRNRDCIYLDATWLGRYCISSCYYLGFLVTHYYRGLSGSFSFMLTFYFFVWWPRESLCRCCPSEVLIGVGFTYVYS
jgi:hypothetical protein